MKKTHYFVILAVGFGLLVSCGGEEETTGPDNGNEQTELTIDTAAFLNDLAALENRIDVSTDIPKEKDLKEAIVTFQDYATIFPEDPKSADYLLRASDFCLTTKQPEKSVKLLKRIINDYPGYGRMEDVKYNYASHLDFELRDTTAAKDAYADFIATYPNSPLVGDCESRIENIRYSAEELAEKFLKQLEEEGL